MITFSGFFACPVQFFGEEERSGFNRGGFCGERLPVVMAFIIRLSSFNFAIIVSDLAEPRIDFLPKS
jgi:hypothetical protein